MRSFCIAIASLNFSTKSFSVFGYKVVKHLTSWPLNELVKLTMLWTTGPRVFLFTIIMSQQEFQQRLWCAYTDPSTKVVTNFDWMDEWMATQKNWKPNPHIRRHVLEKHDKKVSSLCHTILVIQALSLLSVHVSKYGLNQKLDKSFAQSNDENATIKIPRSKFCLS